MRDRLTLVSGALQAATLLLGYYYGAEVVHYPGRPPSGYTRMANVAGLVLLVGAFVSGVSGSMKERAYPVALSLGSLLYGVGVVILDPFYDVHARDKVILAAVVLLPMLIAIHCLVHAKAWVSVGGLTFFLFTCMAMLASNLNVADAGSGFYGWWTS